MKKSLLAVAVVAGLALVGFDASQAEAGTPFHVQIGGPRVQFSIGHGGYGHYGYGYSPHVVRRVYYAPTYGYGHHHHHHHHRYYAPPAYDCYRSRPHFDGYYRRY